MYGSVSEIKEFYKTSLGRAVRAVISGKIKEFWPELRGKTVIGLGYAIPYLDIYAGELDECFSLMPANLGVHHWPERHGPDENIVKGGNRSAIAEFPELPLETNSVDRILLVHSIEYAEMPRPNIQEIWRVLKSDGRLIMVVPNRVGLWARSDRTPFGQGTPYTLGQILYFLRDNAFVFERSVPALFLPPSRSFILRRLVGGALEKGGPYLFPAFGGVHIIEATKRIYAGVGSVHERGSAVVRGRKWLVPANGGIRRISQSKRNRME